MFECFAFICVALFISVALVSHNDQICFCNQWSSCPYAQRVAFQCQFIVNVLAAFPVAAGTHQPINVSDFIATYVDWSLVMLSADAAYCSGLGLVMDYCAEGRLETLVTQSQFGLSMAHMFQV